MNRHIYRVITLGIIGLFTVSTALLVSEGVAAPSASMPAAPIGSLFLYEGRLANVSGNYDLQFRLWDSPSGGALVSSALLSFSNVIVDTGEYRVRLNFGMDVFTGDARYLEVRYRVHTTNPSTPYNVQPSRPTLDPVPYAISLRPGTTMRGNVGGAILRTDHTGSGTGLLASSANGYGVSASSSTGSAVYASGRYSGVYSAASTYGVVGSTSTGIGIYGSGSTGIYGTGANYGVQAFGPIGVFASGSTTGLYGASSDPNGAGVYGKGGQYALRGENARTAGVRGDSGYVGIWGQGGDYGMYALATKTSGQNYGLFAQTSSPAGFAGWFAGNVYVGGTLSKAAGSFKIDHPLDPANKTLSHSFVESPDMMNIYDGVVTLDAQGTAAVQMPTWFQPLNRDFRYQLTAIGAPGPNLYIAQEVKDNQFKIAGGTKGIKVSWQVTGIRQDAYANAHRIPVEEDKPAADRGRYLTPDVFGKPATQGIGVVRAPQGPQGTPAQMPAEPTRQQPPRP